MLYASLATLLLLTNLNEQNFGLYVDKHDGDPSCSATIPSEPYILLFDSLYRDTALCSNTPADDIQEAQAHFVTGSGGELIPTVTFVPRDDTNNGNFILFNTAARKRV